MGAVRYGVLVAPGAPATIDAGHWLALGHQALGGHLESSGSVYPPAVPLLVTGATALLGPVHGVGLVAALSSLAPAVGVFVVLRASGLRWAATALASLLAAAASVGEAATWGGFPQLIGLGLTPPLLWQLDSWRRRGTRRAALGAGLLLAGVLATSHFIGLLAFIGAALVLAVGSLVAREGPSGARTRFSSGPLVLLVAPSLPLVPLYLRLAGTFLRLGPTPAGTRASTGGSGAWRQLEAVFGRLHPLWVAAIALALVTPLLLFDQHRSRLWTVASSLLAAAVITVVLVQEQRALYVAAPAAIIAIGLWPLALRPLPGHLLRRTRRAAPAALVVFLVAEGSWGLLAFPSQREFYGILSPGMVEGIDWIGRETPRGSIVATPALRDAPLGWWVEGLGRRAALTASPLRWLHFDDERRRAAAANLIFRDHGPSEATTAFARRQGVDYLFVPTTWDRYSPAAAAELRARGAAVDYENPAVIIIRVDG